MKSGPPTPTRAPDNQFRSMQDEKDYVRSATGVGVGGCPIPSAMACPRAGSRGQKQRLPGGRRNGGAPMAKAAPLALASRGCHDSCVYIYIYIYIYTYTYIYIYIYVFMCVYIYIYIYIFVYIYIYIYICVHVYVYIYIYCVFIYMLIYVCVRLFAFLFSYIHICSYLYTSSKRY